MDLRPVRQINNGDTGFAAAIYPQVTNSTLDYLRANVQNVYDRIGTGVSMFKDAVTGMFDKYNSDAAIMEHQRVLDGMSNYVGMNEIYRLSEYEQITTANPIMQRYIMAEPTIYKLSRNNMIDGYMDTYTNFENISSPTDRGDYMRVMDGIVQTDKDGQSYYAMYEDGNEKLTHNQQRSIMDTWASVKAFIAEGKDPTDSTQTKV